MKTMTTTKIKEEKTYDKKMKEKKLLFNDFPDFRDAHEINL